MRPRVPHTLVPPHLRGEDRELRCLRGGPDLRPLQASALRRVAGLLGAWAIASGCAAPPAPPPATPVISCTSPDLADVRAVTAQAADTPPVLLGGDFGIQVYARYPDQDRRRGIQGDVVVRFAVAADGTVLCSDVVQSVSPGLDASSRQAVHTARFEPARLDGEPVAAVTQDTVRFRLR